MSSNLIDEECAQEDMKNVRLSLWKGKISKDVQCYPRSASSMHGTFRFEYLELLCGYSYGILLHGVKKAVKIVDFGSVEDQNISKRFVGRQQQIHTFMTLRIKWKRKIFSYRHAVHILHRTRHFVLEQSFAKPPICVPILSRPESMVLLRSPMLNQLLA